MQNLQNTTMVEKNHLGAEINNFLYQYSGATVNVGLVVNFKQKFKSHTKLYTLCGDGG